MDEHQGIRQSKYPMVAVHECVELVLNNTSVTEQCSYLRLDQASKRVLSEDVYAPSDIPRRPTSIMDGYAVHSKDPTFLQAKTESTNNNTKFEGAIFEVTQLRTAGKNESPIKSKSTKSHNTLSKSNILAQISNGQAAYITTGSVLPHGTNSVIKVEDTSLILNKPNYVRLHTFPINNNGQFVRQPGSDMRKGDLILKRGSILHSSEIGLLAMCGIINVPVYSRPRICVLSTGDELIDPFSKSISSLNIKSQAKLQARSLSAMSAGSNDGLLRSSSPSPPSQLSQMIQSEQTAGNISNFGDNLNVECKDSDENENENENETKGMIYDSNRPMLRELLRELSFDVVFIDGGIMSDDRIKLKKYILLLLKECDILITSGGVSMGSRDYIKPILENICNEKNKNNNNKSKIHFGRMLMKPGKPTTFATINLTENMLNNNKEKDKVIVSNVSNNDNDIDTMKLIFGLPGNPVSCNITFKLLIEPCLKKMAGILPKVKWDHAPVNVELAQGITMDPIRPEYHRASIYWDKSKARYIGFSTGFQRSSRLLSMLGANCLLRIPQKEGILKKGSLVKALIIDNMIPDMPPKIDEKSGNLIIQHGCSCEDHGHEHHTKHHHHHDHDTHTHTHKYDHEHNQTHEHSHGHLHRHSHEHSHKHVNVPTIPINVGILTVSDRASQGIYEDKSGPKAMEILKNVWSFDESNNNNNNVKCNIVKNEIVGDDKISITNILLKWSNINNSDNINLILTLGGTGFSKRDVTPEATKSILEKETPGIIFVMMKESLKKTPYAALSRYTAGIVGNSLIINMPGSPKAVSECLTALIPILPHALAEMNKNETV